MDITKDDSSSSDQLREAFRGMAKDKVRLPLRMRTDDKMYVTELDFQHASLPPETIRFLEEVMPCSTDGNGELEKETTNGATRTYDCRFRVMTVSSEADCLVDNIFLQATFAR